ncbi:MAG: alpha-L-glutamate ligase-like protein [Gammaproteobacteria bacterium]|jgi:alpha-L-glutamate ligase-like protein
MIFRHIRALARNGVIGINKRNADYVLAYNRRRYYPLVDDKVQTKLLAQKAGIPILPLYGKIEYPHEAARLTEIVANHGSFVLKPAQGSGGDGILIVTGRSGNLYRLADGDHMSTGDMIYHIHMILAGTFSLAGQSDRALIEYRVSFDPLFDTVSYRGVPDIRIVCLLGVPVMAMVRLPTRMSRGKANLHQGAIGAGISIDEGRTLTAVWCNGVVEAHPDTEAPVTGIPIPHWDRLLEIAARSYELTHLGYQGIDIVLDREKGPLILELNARPGLNIQIANREGLGRRLALVEANVARLGTVEDRVAFAKENFSPRPVPL